MTTWRLLDDGITEAHHHFAVEEALARLLDEGRSPPTLRLRRVQRAVFVGVSQDVWAEVDVDFCRTHGVKIVRRMNGGGAVYHDVGSFCYSAFFPRTFFATAGDRDLFYLFAQPVLHTCSEYGVSAQISGRNDITVGGRKIYGSAQMAWYTAFVQSGTFLVDIDFEMMWKTLKPSALKFADKEVKTIYDRVTSLNRELGQAVPVTAVMARLAHHFAATLDLTLEPGDLTTEERALAEQLWHEKYATDAWNFGERRTWSTRQATKTPLGILMLALELEGELIRSAQVTGDLLLTDGGAALTRIAMALRGVPLAEAPLRVAAVEAPEIVRHAVSALLHESKVESAISHLTVSSHVSHPTKDECAW